MPANHLKLLIFLVIFSFCCFYAPAGLAKKPAVRIAVLAMWGDEIGKKMWQPTIDYLNRKIPSHHFVLTTAHLNEITTLVKNNEVEFVITNPGNYVELEARYGVSRLNTLKSIRNGKVASQFGAVIFTRSGNEDIRTAEELKGKSFMGVDENAFGGFQMAWMVLKKHDIDPSSDLATLQFSGFPQDKIVYAVLKRQVDAGTVRSGTLERMQKEGKIDINDFYIINQQYSANFPFLHSTQLYPEWAFAKLKTTPEKLATQVSIALLALPTTSKAAVAAKSAGWTVPLDYHPVRELMRELQVGPYHKVEDLSNFDVLLKIWWLILLFALILSPPIIFYVRKLQKHINTAQETLAAAETEWSHALDFLDEPIYMVDLDDRVIRANRAFYEKVKATAEQVVGKKVTDFTHPEGEEKPCKIRQARRDQKDTVITLEADDPVNKSGTPMEVSIKVVRDSHHRATSIIQKMVDLTEIRKNEAAIRRSEILFRSLLDATPDPLVVTDQKGNISFVNGKFEQTFGYTKDEIKNKPLELIVPGIMRKKFAPPPINSGRPSVPGKEVFDGFGKDGRYIPLEINLNPFDINDKIQIVTSLHDISKHLEDEKKLKHLASFPELNPMPVVEFQKTGSITYMNPAAKEIFPDLYNKSLQHPALYDSNSVFNILKTQEQVVRDVEIDRSTYEQKFTYNGDTNLYRMYAWDITKMRNMTKQMAYLASHDALTGLLNRHEFEKQLEESIVSAQFEGKTHVLCYMDLDQFKVVNDTCGHIAGDELLKQLASALQAKVRDSDSFARLGGDEFGIIFSGCPIEKAEILADDIRKAVEAFRFRWDNKTFKIGVSIGLVCIDKHSGTMGDILSTADSACYIAKDQGRNRIHTYTIDDSVLLQHTDEMNWTYRIQKALDDDNFILFCQKVSSIDQNDEYYEILVRLKEGNNEFIPPSAFIPAAERFDLMSSVDQWVFHNTMTSMQLPELHGYSFSINLSGQTINDQRVMSDICEKIKKSNIDPKLLCFEITETAMIANLNVAIQEVKELRKLGCKIALDDFGSGLSSFSYLKNLPVDYLKIDGSLVKEIASDPVIYAMVEAIVQIGHKMNLMTVAEFVENNQILDKLKNMDIDYVQGYGIDKPKALTELYQDDIKSIII